MNLDLKKRKDRNWLIRWFYYNQSKGQRLSYNSRFFIVCEGSSIEEKMLLKQDFEQMELKIKAFLEYLKKEKHPFNTVSIDDITGEHKIKSEIITLRPYRSSIKSLVEKPCPRCGSPREISIARLDAYRGNIICKCIKCNCYTNL